jgi:hypothetical protein
VRRVLKCDNVFMSPDAEVGEMNRQPEAAGLSLQEKFYNFLNRKEAGEQRERVQSLAQELYDRIDVDKLIVESDTFAANEYRELLAVKEGVDAGLNKRQGFIENRAVGNMLEYMKENWEKKGMLRDLENEGAMPANEDETSLTEEQLREKRDKLREDIVKGLSGVNRNFAFLHDDQFSDNLALGAENLASVLDLEDRKRVLNSEGFGYNGQAEYDDRFQAAAKRAQALFDGHRSAVGRYVEGVNAGKEIFGEPMTAEQNDVIVEGIAPKIYLVDQRHTAV